MSTCIGCKACQVACSEWNDIREEVGSCVGVYDNPVDLYRPGLDGDALCRNRRKRQAGMADPQGRLHALRRPGCLKACPSPGAIIQYKTALSISTRKTASAAATACAGCPFNVPRLSPADNKAYKCSLCSDRVWRWARNRPA